MKTKIALLFFSLLFLMPSLVVFGEDEKTKQCASKLAKIKHYQGEFDRAVSSATTVASKIKYHQDELDYYTKVALDAELGVVHKEKEVIEILKKENRNYNKDEMLQEAKDLLADKLKYLQLIKQDLHNDEEKQKFHRDNILGLQKEMKALGCLEFPQKELKLTNYFESLNKPSPAPETKPAEPAGADKYKPFIGKWSGTAKITKTDLAGFVGMSAPFALEIIPEGKQLKLINPADPLLKALNTFDVVEKGPGSIRLGYSGHDPRIPEAEGWTNELSIWYDFTVNGNTVTGVCNTETTATWQGQAGKSVTQTTFEMKRQ